MERGIKRPLDGPSTQVETPSKKHQSDSPDAPASSPLQQHISHIEKPSKEIEIVSADSTDITHTISPISGHPTETAIPDSCLSGFPEELLRNVIDFVTDTKDLRSLCLSSRLLGKIASSVLYRNVQIDERSTQFLLRTFLTTPDLALQIRSLASTGIQRLYGRPEMTSHEAHLLNKAVQGIHQELHTTYAKVVDGAWLAMLLIRLPRLQVLDLFITPQFQGSFVENLFSTACNPSSVYGHLFTMLRKVILRAPLHTHESFPLQCLVRLPHLQTLVLVGFYSSEFFIEISKTPSPPLSIKNVILENECAAFGDPIFFSSFKSLESVVIQHWQESYNRDYRPINTILQTQVNSLKHICLAYCQRFFDPSDWRCIHPIGSLKNFEKLSRLVISEYVLLGQNNYPRPALIDILPQSLESLHITEWVGPHREQIQGYHASCRNHFPTLREVHIWDCYRPFKKGTRQAFGKVGIQFCRHSDSFAVDLG